MASSLSAMAARRAATLAPSSSPATRAASLVPRRGVSGGGHEPPKDDRKNGIDLEGIVILSCYNVYVLNQLCPLDDEKDKEEKVVEPKM